MKHVFFFLLIVLSGIIFWWAVSHIPLPHPVEDAAVTQLVYLF